MEDKYALIENDKIVNVCVCDESWEPPQGVIKLLLVEAVELYDFLEKPIQNKVWNSAQEFVAEFTVVEMAQISLSTNPVIAAMRFKLSTWFSYVESVNPDVALGMKTLVSEGIISEERKNQIFGV